MVLWSHPTGTMRTYNFGNPPFLEGGKPENGMTISKKMSINILSLNIKHFKSRFFDVNNVCDSGDFLLDQKVH